MTDNTQLRTIVALTLVGIALAADETIDWATGKTYDDYTLRVGDTLTLTWSGTHSVYLTADAAAYGECSSEGSTEWASTSVSTFAKTFEEADAGMEFHLICGVDGHCSMGQKLKVTVEAAPSRAPTAPGETWTPTTQLCGVNERMRSFACDGTQLMKTLYAASDTSCSGEVETSEPYEWECGSNSQILHCPGGSTHPEVALFDAPGCDMSAVTANGESGVFSAPWSDTLNMPFCNTNCEENQADVPPFPSLLDAPLCVFDCPELLVMAAQYMGSGGGVHPSKATCAWMWDVRFPALDPAKGTDCNATEECCTVHCCTSDCDRVSVITMNAVVDPCWTVSHLGLPDEEPSGPPTRSPPSPTIAQTTTTSMETSEDVISGASEPLKIVSMLMLVAASMFLC